jgi:histidinol-phosphatase
MLAGRSPLADGLTDRRMSQTVPVSVWTVDDLTLALVLADLADRETLASFNTADVAIWTKRDGSLVSDTDVRVEAALCARLRQERPGDAVLGEEGGAHASTVSERCWIIDPIDHTNNFVRGIPVFATLIALRVAGEITVGVVSAPGLGRRWWAQRGHGAHSDTGGPLRTSGVDDPTEAHISFAALDVWADRGCLPGVLALARRSRFVFGSGGFWAHMLVAEGRLEASLDPWGELWDIAAVQVIVEEAGGRLTDVVGVARPDGGCAVVTNGLLHPAVLATLTGAPPAPLNE